MTTCSEISDISLPVLSRMNFSEMLSRIDTRAVETRDQQLIDAVRLIIAQFVQKIAQGSQTREFLNFNTLFEKQIKTIRDDHLRQNIRAILQKTHTFVIKIEIDKIPPQATNASQLVQFYNEHQTFVPSEFKAVDLQDHTIPLKEYIFARLSGPVRDFLQQFPVEIFVGLGEDVFRYYSSECTYRATLHCNSSFVFDLFLKQNKPLLVIHGIGNQSRLVHLYLLLKAHGVNLDQIIIRGDMPVYQQRITQTLETTIEDIKKIDLAIIGNQTQVLTCLAARVYQGEVEAAVKKMKESSSTTTRSIENLFTISVFRVNERVVISTTMPNGELSGRVTELLLRHETHNLAMVGAGGGFDGMIGEMQIIDSSQFGEKSITLSQNSNITILRPPDAPEFPKTSPGRNITVRSPIEETVGWLREAAGKYTCVDVETHHIFQALQNCRQHMNVLPGLFISDLVGKVALREKIDSKNAWQRLSVVIEYLLNLVFSSV